MDYMSGSAYELAPWFVQQTSEHHWIIYRRRYLYNILCALQYMHSGNVAHRDLVRFF